MLVKKISSTKWYIEMSDDEVADFVNMEIAKMIRLCELMNKEQESPKRDIAETLLGLVVSLKTNRNSLALSILEKKEPLFMNFLKVQCDISSPTSECPFTKPKPPNESDNFPA